MSHFWLRKLLSAPFKLAAGAVLVFTLTGCPVAQTPGTPTDSDDNGTVTQPPPSDDDDIDRPVTPPPPDDTTTTDSDDDETDGGGGGGGGGGDDDTAGDSFVALNVSGPTDSLRTRPGTSVNLVYQLQDPDGAVTTVEAVFAYDSDNNNEPDGGPVFSLPMSSAAGNNTFTFNTASLTGVLTNGFARLKIGVRLRTVEDEIVLKYASGSLVVDSEAPTGEWITPQTDLMTNRTEYTLGIRTVDNSPVTVSVILDPDTSPGSGDEVILVNEADAAAGTVDTNLSPSLIAVPAGLYNVYVVVSDGIDPPHAFYASRSPTDTIKIRVTDRLIGDFDLNLLANQPQFGRSRGAVLQGFNFNDLAGSSISRVPDLNGDGIDEMIVGSRFGKAYIIEHNGVGFGEAYLVYGQSGRLRNTRRLNSVGVDVPGLVFPGIRTPRNATSGNASTRWTAGLSDITVIPDMDGDGMPELVFSFPRVESINLGLEVPSIQHPELFPDLTGMGNLEYNAFYGLIPVWHPNESQFTRGGVVIVSSHNELLQNPNLLNRKSDRVLDLHEAGQLFSGMSRPGLVPYIRQVLQRNQLDPFRAAPFTVCADCDFLPPDGWEPGDIGDPLDPEDDEPGQCGDDGCGWAGDCNDPRATDPWSGNIHDGREQILERWFVQWDVTFNNQGPGGFHQPWTIPPADPPLANPSSFPFALGFPFGFYPNIWYPAACAASCEVTNEWFSWFPTVPCTTIGGSSSWDIGGNPPQTPTDCYPNNPPGPFDVQPEIPCCDLPPELCPEPGVDTAASGVSVWTGFYGPNSVATVSVATGQSFPTPIGARILGQAVDDQFGTAVASDGSWLYISAPRRTANADPYPDDVPSLSGSRTQSGIVYQLRTNAPGPNGVTRTQLWLERGTRTIPDPNDPNETITVPLSWPNVDLEDPSRTDYTMPVPHQYIIESGGSLRGNPNQGLVDLSFEGDCPPSYIPATSYEDPTTAPTATACQSYTYPVGTAGYYMDRTPQIVGPHTNARIEFVRALGDVDGDGIRDFAVGSSQIRSNIGAGTGDTVGAIFIVYGRPTGLEGDYLLEQLALDIGNPSRLEGVVVKGSSAGETLARVFADAGDINDDGYADVIIGNEGFEGGRGEAIILLGSPTLLSPGPNDAGGVPGGGWTPATIPPGRAIRLRGAEVGDLAGASVSGAGDVDGDGFDDVLVAAPGTNDGQGFVYLIYGAEDDDLPEVIELATLSPTNIATPFAKFIGRGVGDFLGGGAKMVTGTHPTNPTLGTITAASAGIAPLGDIDGDGNADFAISSMLADPNGTTDAGEVYILYGEQGP